MGNGHATSERKAVEAPPPAIPAASSSIVEVVQRFWTDVVTSSEEIDQQMYAMTLYKHLFDAHPEYRELFGSGRIQIQALRLFRMFTWLISNAGKDDFQAKLEKLGVRHQTVFGVKLDMYRAMRDAFDAAARDFAGVKYTPRVQYAFNQVFGVAAATMMGEFTSTHNGESYNPDVFAFMESLPACMNHPEGNRQFRLFLRRRLCEENYQFLKRIELYKRASLSQRQKVAIEIIDHFVRENSTCEVNMSAEMRNELIAVMDRAPLEMFDRAEAQILELLSQNWKQFRASAQCQQALRNVVLGAQQAGEMAGFDRFR